MALGRGMSAAVPDYISMAQNADRAGMQQAQGIAGLMERGFKLGSQMEDRDRMKQAREAFQGAWNSDNPADIQRVMAAFPEYAAQIQKLLGVRDDQHRKDVGSMAVQLGGLLDDNNIQGAQDYIRQHKGLFDPSGTFSADSVANAIGAAAQDPQKLGQWKNWAQKLTLSTLSPEEATNYGLNQQRLAQQYDLNQQHMQLQRELEQSRIGMQGARLQEITNFHNQMLELKRQGILNAGGTDVMADTHGNPLSAYDYNRLLLQTGSDPRTGKRATGAQLSNAQKWMKGNQDFTSSQETLQQQTAKIDELLKGKNLEAGTGRVEGRLPDYAISEKGQNTRNLIDSIKSGEFTTNVQKLRGMGALSNAEGSKLMDLTAKLDITHDPKVLRKQINEVRDQYKKLQAANAQDAADMGFGQSVLKAYQGQDKNVGDLSDDELLEGL